MRLERVNHSCRVKEYNDLPIFLIQSVHEGNSSKERAKGRSPFSRFSLGIFCFLLHRSGPLPVYIYINTHTGREIFFFSSLPLLPSLFRPTLILISFPPQSWFPFERENENHESTRHSLRPASSIEHRVRMKITDERASKPRAVNTSQSRENTMDYTYIRTSSNAYSMRNLISNRTSY